MKIPFPSINSKLAYSAHMYICMESEALQYVFAKCQTLKPYMLFQKTMKNYCDEAPDIARNPFVQMTRIDCDKRFSTSGVQYDARLLTTNRPDICEELFEKIAEKLSEAGEDICLDEKALISLNPLVSRIFV